LFIESPYTHPALRITVKTPGALFVRVPAGVAPEAITISGTETTARFINGYLFLASPPVDVPLTISFQLPETQIVLHHRTRDIRVKMRGDQAVAMDNFGADLTYFDPIY
jgi:hypothetical protein